MRIAVISDIHANLEALRAVLADIDARGVDAIWCLGDLVGYGPEPNACVELIRERAEICLGGNHDLAALGDLDIARFNVDAAQVAEWTHATLTPEARRYLSMLPNRLVQDPFTLAHGSPREPVWEYVLSYAVAQRNFQILTTPYCLVGHTHYPSVWRRPAGATTELDCLPLKDQDEVTLDEDMLILNPGSVGQPRDGDPRASYLLIDLPNGLAQNHRVEYDIAATQARMRELGLPPRLIERLAMGW
jgi:diadenosine tetraphosphatase ApaH/serine/threonine PP2A family protein phosphatase